MQSPFLEEILSSLVLSPTNGHGATETLFKQLHFVFKEFEFAVVILIEYGR
ncbi:hypothetical protein [Roseivirga echinicomitans]|uniref:hypothetical protein n=1 Tax=Roseivirga echinicomitans TaxID=296218 RepID=UPI000AA65560|nr:hypothetical protein [Roseivirga echinicomitans]